MRLLPWVSVLLSPVLFFFLHPLSEAMAPSLRWLLLLWGLQGLWAQDFDGRYEEERLAGRRRNAQLPSNVIPQNGQGKLAATAAQEVERVVQ